jgi:hypothetical protein
MMYARQRAQRHRLTSGLGPKADALFGMDVRCATMVLTQCTANLMICDEKARLAAEYNVATAKFSEAVAELQRTIGTSTKVEYEHLQRVSDEARVKSEQARLALEQHLAAHGC